MRFSLIFLLSFFLTTASVFAEDIQCEQQKCAVVVDVGSTGSRLHFYSYDLDKTNSPINITERSVKKIKPGSATIEPNEQTIDAYLTLLFAQTPAMKELPVYFYATAGMRLLSQSKQKQFYTLVDRWFKQHQGWQLVSAKTISGNDEGLYGWLALNYQLQNFSATKPAPIGFMDMGGASVEVVFPVVAGDRTQTKDIKEITLYGHRFKVFIHSFLGLGMTEVTHQFLDTASCFIKDYELPTGLPAQGDGRSCETEVSGLINIVHHVSQVIQPVLSKNPMTSWYITGGLESLVKSQPFHFANNQFTSLELLDQADSAVCAQSWQDLSSQFPENEYLYGFCLYPAYYYALMVEGYGISPNQALNYLPETKSADWTLGVVLSQYAT